MTAPRYVGRLGYWSLVQHADNVIARELTATERHRAWAHIIQTDPGFRRLSGEDHEGAPIIRVAAGLMLGHGASRLRISTV